MTTRFPSRLFVCLLALVVALPLGLGAARSAAGLTSAPSPGARSANVQPPHPEGPDVEVLVGELRCGPSTFGPDPLLSFRPSGTVEVSTDALGLISHVITAPQDPCPAIFLSATDVLQDLGCKAGPNGVGGLIFVCHDRRNAILGVIATVSEGVLAGSF